MVKTVSAEDRVPSLSALHLYLLQFQILGSGYFHQFHIFKPFTKCEFRFNRKLKTSYFML